MIRSANEETGKGELRTERPTSTRT